MVYWKLSWAKNGEQELCKAVVKEPSSTFNVQMNQSGFRLFLGRLWITVLQNSVVVAIAICIRTHAVRAEATGLG